MAASLSPLEADLARFILEELSPSIQRTLDPELPLFESLLDSTSVLGLLDYLEANYHFSIAADEVVPQHFATLRQLAAFVRAKTEAASVPAPAAARAAIPGS